MAYRVHFVNGKYVSLTGRNIREAIKFAEQLFPGMGVLRCEVME